MRKGIPEESAGSTTEAQGSEKPSTASSPPTDVEQLRRKTLTSGGPVSLDEDELNDFLTLHNKLTKPIKTVKI